MSGGLVAVVYANHGAWVADCPVPYCTGAEHYGIREGELGRLSEIGFTCKRAECGWQGPARWPGERAAIARVLMERPDPRTRSWVPPESLFDLMQENIRNGIYPQASLEAAQTPLEAFPARKPGDGVEVSEVLTGGDLTSELYPGASTRALTAGIGGQ